MRSIRHILLLAWYCLQQMVMHLTLAILTGRPQIRVRDCPCPLVWSVRMHRWVLARSVGHTFSLWLPRYQRERLRPFGIRSGLCTAAYDPRSSVGGSKIFA